MNASILILAVLFLFCWALVHGGTKDPQPRPIIYDDDHDVSGLLEED
jgi:hypothetical protein